MAGSDKVLINLATGMEDGERVLVAFLVATAAQQQGKFWQLHDLMFANHGKLSRKELEAAPAILMKLDADDDETVSLDEIMPTRAMAPLLMSMASTFVDAMTLSTCSKMRSRERPFGGSISTQTEN